MISDIFELFFKAFLYFSSLDSPPIQLFNSLVATKEFLNFFEYSFQRSPRKISRGIVFSYNRISIPPTEKTCLQKNLQCLLKSNVFLSHLLGFLSIGLFCEKLRRNSLGYIDVYLNL